MERPQSPPEQPAGMPDWPHVEDGFWRSLQSTYEAEDKMLADEYRKSKASIQVTLSELYHERSSVAERLRRIDSLCSAEEARMETLQSQFEDNRRVRFAMRDGTVAKMRQWFTTNRGGAAGVPPPTPGLPIKSTHPMNVGAPMASARSVPLPSVVTNEPTGVEICDIAGNVLGPLNKIRTRNPAIDAICDRPAIKRRVKVRPNRKYGSQNLSLLYEPTDTKGGKWIACMIQATGEVQPRKCTICQKGQGPFEECIMLDRDGFNKCGNCEWSRQGCHGSTRDPNGPANPNASEGDGDSATRQLALRSPGASVHGLALAARPVAGGVGSVGSPTTVAAAASAASAAHRLSHGPVAAVQPASPAISSRSALVGPVPRPGGGPNAAGPSTGAASHHTYTPNPNKHHIIEASNTPYHSNAPSPGDDDVSESGVEPEMITLENLAIKHDGTVYTEPECLRGVPVAKIDQSHPYWDPSWENIEDLIRPQYEKWLAKQDQVLKTGGVVQHAKFQIGRQVNRGARILEFLKNGSISPYQLLAKQYMPVGKGGIISYDTLFRLANTLEELAQFKQKVDPVDWLRHRLHEIRTAEGDKFSLSRSMHGFYHDPKLSALRKKSGFSQIGRPSRVRTRPDMGGSGGGPAQKRRRGNDSPRATPPTTPGLWRGPPTPADQMYAQSPAIGTEDDGEDILMADDGDDGNVTDTDSYCGEAIEPTDFRVYQVKHRNLSSNPAMTQYWHWLDDEDERSLQHQVLKDVNPTQWGMYREPLNFSVNFQEVLEVLFAPSSQRVVVVMDETAREDDGKPRGDVLVHFKRDRTLRRFCKHMASKGIRVRQTLLENVEDRWDRMQCPMLPSHDDDDNIEV